MKRVLVTGGAGYIGSHTVRLLLEMGYEVIVLDDLSRGQQRFVEPSRLRVLRLQDTGAVTELLSATGCEAVVHFAGSIEVGESMQKPELYFENNVGGSLSLLTAMVKAGVRKLVFSSTSAVYGIPKTCPIPETSSLAPVNVYGLSKAMVEEMLAWFDRIHGLRSIALRYFNACGADPSGEIGEEHAPETHIVPLLLRAAHTGVPVTLFGDDYPTPDGTCVRDYVHVNDLASAHLLALEALKSGAATTQFNVGTGRGYSVRELMRAVEEITGCKVPHVVGPRRAGDPPILVANTERLRTTLGWSPEHSDIRAIVETAWNYFRRQNSIAVSSG